MRWPPAWRRGEPAADWLLAELPSPEALLDAAEACRDAGYTRFDAHSPFPVHGMERAMGLRASRVPWFVLVLGLGGAAAGMGLQWWVSAVAYPLVISGKPFFSWPAFVPIMFETGVLGGALGAVGGLLFEAGLPRHHHPLFHSTAFEGFSDDRFFLSLSAADPRFDDRVARRLLADAGALRVERIAADGTVTTLAPAAEGAR